MLWSERREGNWCLTSFLLPETQDGIAAALRHLVQYDALCLHLLLRVAKPSLLLENYFLWLLGRMAGFEIVFKIQIGEQSHNTLDVFFSYSWE